MTGRKSLPELVRERSWDIHRRWCEDDPCPGPTPDDREQATREVMASEEAK